MSSTALSYEERLKARYKAVSARCGKKPANVNIRAGIALVKPVEAIAPVIREPEDPPEWKTLDSCFDDHVTKWAMYKTTKWHLSYARKRAIELGFESFEALLGQGRHKRAALTRQIILYEIREQTNGRVSFPELGRIFGGLDHSTCVHAVEKIKEIGYARALDEQRKLRRAFEAPPRRHKTSKLLYDEVRRIRELEGKRPVAIIAKSYAVSENSIRAIWRGETWKHVK